MNHKPKEVDGVEHIDLTPEDLSEFLLKVAKNRPVFIWGSPGIGKSDIVKAYAKTIGLECVALLGSQLSPEDIIGIPQMMDGTFRFCPPRMIARHEPYCLFLDEFNACTTEVQKVFYTLIHDRRIGEYVLPEGSVVLAAGNRAQDHAIVLRLSSALINRMVHVHLNPTCDNWINWAKKNHLHPLIIDYIATRPEALVMPPNQDEQPFSTPRSWHILSDSLSELDHDVSDSILSALCLGSLSKEHANDFLKFIKGKLKYCSASQLLENKVTWAYEPDKRHYLKYLAYALKKYLAENLPEDKKDLEEKHAQLMEEGIVKFKKLDEQFPELVSEVLFVAGEERLPDWFLDHFAQQQGKFRQFMQAV
jgi:hypothetical protein